VDKKTLRINILRINYAPSWLYLQDVDGIGHGATSQITVTWTQIVGLCNEILLRRFCFNFST